MSFAAIFGARAFHIVVVAHPLEHSSLKFEASRSSFFVVCSFVSSHSAWTISVMSLKMRTSESECEKPSGQTAFHIPSTLSLFVKRATKTQEIIECRNS